MCIMVAAMKKTAKSDSNEIVPEDAVTGAKFRAAREAAGLTQSELAERLEWLTGDGSPNQQQVSHLEVGRRKFTLEDALAYAEAIEADLNEILGLKKKPVKQRK